MFSAQSYKFEKKRDCVVIRQNGTKLGTMTFDSFYRLKASVNMVPDQVDVTVKKKKAEKRIKPNKSKPQSKVEREDSFEEAVQLSKCYTAEYRKHTRNKNIAEIATTDSSFSHFLKAIEIVKRHDVTYKKFIESQVDGLSFVGRFPKPYQLSTSNAEDRLVEFLHVDDVKKNGRLVITKQDKEVPLTKNTKYLAARDRVEKCIASLEETEFVRDLQQARRGRVESYVTEYYDVIKEDVD